jgi:rhodopsin domain-containing protein
VATAALVTKGIFWGLGRHIYYLSPVQIQNVVKYIVLMNAPVIVGVSLARASFCLFLLNTIGAERRVRLIIWITLILQGLVNVSQLILFYSSCGTHMNALWDVTVQAKCLPYTAMVNYLYFLGGLYPFLLGQKIMH